MLLGDLPVGATPILKFVIVLADSGVLLSLPSAINAFVSEVWFFSVLQGGYFDYCRAYLAYHLSLEDH